MSQAGDISKPAVRAGHLRYLAFIEDTEAYRRTRALYAEHVGPRGVYLRPTDKGLTVISLDFERCQSMIGVGEKDSQVYLRALPPEAAKVEEACRAYEAKRDSLRRSSVEERHALELMARALGDGLRLPGLDACFIHQEWRIAGDKIDILGVDPEAGRLVVIELKASEADARRVDHKKGGDALAQAEAYAEAVYRDRAELYPFFQRLGRALARAHGAPESMLALKLKPEKRPMVRVDWPGRVEGLAALPI